MSFLRYGSYDFTASSLMFTISKRVVFGRTGRVEFVRSEWDVRGFLDGADASALSTKIAALEAALDQGQDLKFMLDSSTESQHTLLTDDCLNGVNIKNFQWLGTTQRGSGVEYVLRRSFRIVFEGDQDSGYQDTDIVFWTETVGRICDGIAFNVWVESLTGLPEYQTTILHPKHVTLQIGRAVGRTDWPDPADPIWTSPYYISKPGSVNRTTPSYVGVNEQRNYQTSWKYHYESDVVLVGNPTIFTP